MCRVLEYGGIFIHYMHCESDGDGLIGNLMRFVHYYYCFMVMQGVLFSPILR
jgi:hypothetical protein